MLGITRGASDRRKFGTDEGSELVLLDVSIEGAWADNFEAEGHGEGDPLGD